MPSKGILCAAAKGELRDRLLEILDRSLGSILADRVNAVPDVPQLVHDRDYDAAVVALENDEDLTIVVRLRKLRPELPIYLVTADKNGLLLKRARQARVGSVIPIDGRTGTGGELLVQALRAQQAGRSLQEKVGRAHSLSEEIGALIRENRSIRRRAGGAASSRPFATLLVEDNPDQAFFTTRALIKVGFPDPIRVATDGEEAIAYLQGTGDFQDRSRFPVPSLVLLDLRLPRKSGFEVLEWARAQAEFRELPIVILTTSDAPADQDRAAALGASSYLVKPLELRDLTAMAEQLRRTWLPNLRLTPPDRGRVRGVEQ
ncbi:MAG TPA: response regulator [Planctomycetota bacterium]|nr:response regulator [Planctomycetota bacterium]